MNIEEEHDKLCERQTAQPPFLGPLHCWCHERRADNFLTDNSEEMWLGIKHAIAEMDCE